MAYIEQEAAISELKSLPEQERLEYMGVYDCIKSVPAADVVEVVRCGQCGNYCKNTGGCNLCGIYPNENDFCSYGVRKDGDNR